MLLICDKSTSPYGYNDESPESSRMSTFTATLLILSVAIRNTGLRDDHVSLICLASSMTRQMNGTKGCLFPQIITMFPNSDSL